VFSWSDRSIHTALAASAAVIVGLSPWHAVGTRVGATASIPLAVAASGCVVLLAGLNWRIGAMWVSRVAELHLARNERLLTANDRYYEADSCGSEHELAVFSGAALMYLGYLMLAPLAIGYVASSVLVLLC
jgi:hypothetical protein